MNETFSNLAALKVKQAIKTCKKLEIKSTESFKRTEGVGVQSEPGKKKISEKSETLNTIQPRKQKGLLCGQKNETSEHIFPTGKKR